MFRKVEEEFPSVPFSIEMQDEQNDEHQDIIKRIPKILFTTAEAAQYLNLSQQTLTNWRHQRKNLSYCKIGRLPMYEKSVFDGFIRSNRVEIS